VTEASLLLAIPFLGANMPADTPRRGMRRMGLDLGLPDSNGAGLIVKLRNLCPGYTALILNHRGNERQRGRQA
jgi:hypothetical protein